MLLARVSQSNVFATLGALLYNLGTQGRGTRMSILNVGPTYDTGEPIMVGDWVKVYVPKLVVWHHGIVRRIYRVYDGFAVEIAHNMKATGVTLSDWHIFRDGGSILLDRRPASEAHTCEIIARVDANTGKPYALFAQNCEHFASFAFNGKAESKSVQVVGAVALGILAIWLFGG